jgi:hypothetical protein
VNYLELFKEEIKIPLFQRLEQLHLNLPRIIGQVCSTLDRASEVKFSGLIPVVKYEGLPKALKDFFAQNKLSWETYDVAQSLIEDAYKMSKEKLRAQAQKYKISLEEFLFIHSGLVDLNVEEQFIDVETAIKEFGLENFLRLL